ncbi:PAN-3 domain-containing protein [Caenorhabditis elegans]|uniref:PAN-3 domain-containing protein n=1 Tax=Caenorhabditis elegans TaxID=6239 RepID=O02126_CAEEL|nr:PAN-3 domain-containing protein [Caenorhabditis elegans]CCD68676.2 PAN-3 domain-containing protein [Caenorhabditis elegans]|eukprot:NP_500691.2 Uncharacterized protein CELE_E03H12.4 [Caenorhabditis elegans]
MLLFWGFPSSNTKFCEPQVAIGAFENCIQLCINDTFCIIAFGNDSSCTLCDIYFASKITQSNSTSNVQTAIKVDSQLQCPKNITTNQYSYTNGYNNYKVIYSEPIWTISYDKNCIDETFRMFPRPAGAFCLTVPPPTGINYINSSASCKASGSGMEIAGMQSEKEFNYVLKTAKVNVGFDPSLKYKSVWLTGKMRSACQTRPIPDGCTGLNAFEGFPYQDNFDVYKLAPGYPHISTNVTSRCLQLLLAQTENGYEGMIYDALCDWICDGQSPAVICVSTFTCGGLAF